MTTVTVTIGGIDRSAYVLQAETWREALSGIGRWEVILDPRSILAMSGLFAVDNSVVISINGSVQMTGYIDDILPFMPFKDESTFDPGLVIPRHVGQWKLIGRDRGMDLAQHYVSGEWQNVRADNLVQTLLGIIPSEINYVSPGAAPFIDYEANRTFLGDAIRDIAQLINYDFYVDDATPPVLHFFAIGAAVAHTGTDLYHFPNVVPTVSRRPILDIEVGEAVGFGIKNYVEAHAGGLADHYTDLNAAAWVGFNAAITDDVATFLNGKGAIRATNNFGGPAIIGATLSFPYGNHADLNLSEPTTGNYNYFMSDTSGTPSKRCRIQLTDNGGRIIEFYRAKFPLPVTKCFNCTDSGFPAGPEWRKVDFPLGDECGIEPALVASTKGIWYEVNWVSPPVFNWYNVTDIAFFTTGHPVGVNNGDFFVVDGLQMPNVEVISIQQVLPVPAVGRRMRDFYRPDIKNQVELDAFAVAKLAELQDPKETIVSVTSEGSTLNDFAAQSLDVCAPLFGIGGPLITNVVRYRILTLHHKVVKNAESAEYGGWTFTTDYSLVRNQISGADQVIDQYQVLSTGSPDISQSYKTYDKQRRRRVTGGPLYPVP